MKNRLCTGLLAVSLTVLVAATPSGTRPSAGGSAPARVPTLVTRDGQVWALVSGTPPVPLDIDTTAGDNDIVTGLAWHPSGAELLPRRVCPPREGELVDHDMEEVVRLQLAWDVEQLLSAWPAGIKIAADVPKYGPNGDWVVVQLHGYSGGGEVLLFEGGAETRIPNDQFLGTIGAPTDVPESYVWRVAAGQPAPDGRLPIAVRRTNGASATPRAGPPLTGLAAIEGLYVVDRRLTRYERLTSDTPPWPIGVGPDGGWIAGVRPDDRSGGPSLVKVDLPGGGYIELATGDSSPDG